MELTIHYIGKLKDAFELQSMIDEVRAIAIEKKWDYFVFEEKFENNSFTSPPEIDKLFGIMVVPEGSEPLCFSFLSDGRMCGLINFNVSKGGREIDEELTFSLFTKTEYAGTAIHKQLVVLLDFISKKYLTDFKCSDEGQYWETRDEDLLTEIFKRFGTAADGFANSLEMPPNEDENIEDFITRLATATQHRIEDEDLEGNLPVLPIEDEIKFKRMKIELEYGGHYDIGSDDIPPEIENMFLDNILAFENRPKNGKQITVFEKIGKPDWIKSSELSAEALELELERLDNLLEDHSIILEVLYDYDNENVLIYDFITNEFFEMEVDEIFPPGMMINFTYEEFHPNHYEDLNSDSFLFWEDYFENMEKRPDAYNLEDLLNAGEAVELKRSFSDIENLKIKVIDVKFNLETATGKTSVSLIFEGVVNKQAKIKCNCISTMDFVFQDNYWDLQDVKLRNI